MSFSPDHDFEVVIDDLRNVELQNPSGVTLAAAVRSRKRQVTLSDINTLHVTNLTRSDAKFRLSRDDFPTQPLALERIVESDGTAWEVVISWPRVADTQWEVIARPLGTPQSLGTRLLTLALPSANTEYSLALGLTNSLSLRCRDEIENIRVALVAGKVAGPTDPYHTVYARQSLSLTLQPPVQTSLYAASGTAGVVLEIIAR